MVFHFNVCYMLLLMLEIHSLSGAFDLIRQPKNISEYSKQNICFHMFVDEETHTYLRNSSEIASNNKVGLWRIIVVQNLPYFDPRRNGKVNVSKITNIVQ